MTLFRTGLLVYTVALTYASLRPVTGEGRGQLAGWLLHIAAYLGLGLLVAWSFPDRFKKRRISTLVGVALFGLFLEIVQLFLATRSFSIIDIAMNTVGAGIVWFKPLITAQITSGEGREDEIDQDEVRPGDLEGEVGRPDDMRMIGDRQE